MVSSPLLVWEAGREMKVREGKIMSGTYFRIFIIRKAHHYHYYRIASFYCQEVNSFPRFLAWFSLRLCFQPCNLRNAEFDQPLLRNWGPCIYGLHLSSLAPLLFRQGAQPGESTTHMKPWELTRGIAANWIKIDFFSFLYCQSQVFCFLNKHSPRLTQEKYLSLLLFFGST